MILVTGATGLIGSYMVRELKFLGHGNKVVALLHTEPKGRFINEVLEGVKTVYGDLRDFAAVKEAVTRYNVDKVIHLAALAKVKTAYLDPISTFDVNLMGTLNLLESLRQVKEASGKDIRTLVMMTDKVYGSKKRANEYSHVMATEPYGTSKSCQRLLAECYADTFGLDVVMPHSCNAFGYDPYSDRIFPNVIKKVVQGMRPWVFTNDKSKREYIYVKDLVGALLELLNMSKYKGSYNISTGMIMDNEEVVMKILEHFPDLEPVYKEVKLPPQVEITTMKSIKSDWQWNPEYNLSTAISETVNLFTEYKEDWA